MDQQGKHFQGHIDTQCLDSGPSDGWTDMWSQESGQIVYIVERQNATYESQGFGPGLHPDLTLYSACRRNSRGFNQGPDSK